MNKKTFTAFIIMLIMVVAAIPFGVHNSLSREKDKASNSYYYDSTGFAIYEGIDSRVDAAENLITVANRYTDENPNLSSLINEVDRSIKEIQNVSYRDFEAEGKANNNLTGTAQALADELETCKLSERDAKYPKTLMAEMDSQQDMIVRSSYNGGARAFNDKLTKFPVNIIKPFAFISPLYVFE